MNDYSTLLDIRMHLIELSIDSYTSRIVNEKLHEISYDDTVLELLDDFSRLMHLENKKRMS